MKSSAAFGLLTLVSRQSIRMYMVASARDMKVKGLVLALLHHSFGIFHDRGYKRVGLGVDSENLDRATDLFKKAGMRVAHEFVNYEKELQAGIELSKQSA